MNLKTLDLLLQRATSLGFAVVVTLGMLGGIDSLAKSPQYESETMAQVAAPKA
jgi:hypothetical protein